jgi:hypothetical protein
MSIIQGIIFIKRKVLEQVRTFARDSIYYFVESNDTMNKKTIEAPLCSQRISPTLVFPAFNCFVAGSESS